jgi:hypothetical protein
MDIISVFSVTLLFLVSVSRRGKERKFWKRKPTSLGLSILSAKIAKPNSSNFPLEH